MWQHHHIPQWWQDFLMTLLPKEPGVHDLSKIRPIFLFEVIGKMRAGMVTTRIQRIWHAGLLHSHQHGFLMQHGTHTAILEVLNHFKHVRTAHPTHLTFWDIRRAFDSVPKWLQRLAWARRLGLSVEDLEWFLKLDAIWNIVIRTPHQQSHMARTTDMATGAMLDPI